MVTVLRSVAHCSKRTKLRSLRGFVCSSLNSLQMQIVKDMLLVSATTEEYLSLMLSYPPVCSSVKSSVFNELQYLACFEQKLASFYYYSWKHNYINLSWALEDALACKSERHYSLPFDCKSRITVEEMLNTNHHFSTLHTSRYNCYELKHQVYFNWFSIVFINITITW